MHRPSRLSRRPARAVVPGPRAVPPSIVLGLIGSLALAALVSSPPADAFTIEDLTRGRLVATTVDSPTVGATDLLVYLPPDYLLDDARHPVVYWLHSSIDDETELLDALAALPGPPLDGSIEERAVARLDALIGGGMIEPMLFVAIGSPSGVWTEVEERLVVQEIPTLIDASLRTVPHRGGRALEGFSLGSEGVSRYATARPDVFGVASLLGGAFRVELWQERLESLELEGLTAALSTGEDDQFLPGVVELDQILDASTVPHTVRVPAGVGHSVSGLYSALGEELLAEHSERLARARRLDAGPPVTVDEALPVAVELAGRLDDPDGTLDGASFEWSQVDGPAPASLAPTDGLETTATIDVAGRYLFRLRATILDETVLDAPILDETVLDDTVRVVAVDTSAQLSLHLPFDDGTAVDTSGAGRHGALLGTPQPTTGRVGGALAFAGVDDAVSVADFTYGPAFTLATWVRPDTLEGSGYQYVASHGGFEVQPSMNLYLPENGAALGEGSGGRLRAALRDVDDPAGERITVTDAVEAGTWRHVALVVGTPGGGDPGQGYRLLVDGVVRGVGANGGDTLDPAGDLFFARRSVSPADRYFDGALDEIRLYDRALGDAELGVLASRGGDGDSPPLVDAGPDQTVYRPGGGVLAGSVVDLDLLQGEDDTLEVTWTQIDGPAGVVIATPNLPLTAITFAERGVYRFRLEASDGATTAADEVEVTVLEELEPGLVARWTVTADPPAPADVLPDRSGLGHDVALSGEGTLPDRICAPTGTGLRFDAADRHRGQVEASPLLDLDPSVQPFTVTAWLRAEPGAEGTLVARGSGVIADRQLQIFLFDDDDDGASDLLSVVGGALGDEARRLGVRVDDGAWHHVALVHDDVAATQRLLIDGVPVGDPQPSGSVTRFDLPLLLGARSLDAQDTTFHLDGALDDVRVWLRALDDAEIADLAAEGDLAACLPLFADGFESGDPSAWGTFPP